MGRPLLLLAALLSLALAACKSPEQRLVDRRRELRATLDRAYADYRAGEDRPEERADAGVLGRIAGEVDRAWFEGRCLASGRGERGLPLSARLEAFLGEERNARSCRKAADLESEVQALERQISGVRG